MDYWHKQSKDQPLFPDLLWSRPENRRLAGKLVIIGGNSYGFAAVAEAYAVAQKAGVGTARVLLPDAIKKTVGPLLPEGEFAPTNPSGGFRQSALAEWLDLAGWGDGVLLAGDFGRNAETAILSESFLQKFSGAVTITKDGVDYFSAKPEPVINRPDTTLVLSLAQLQKLFTGARFNQAITFDMDLLKLVALLHDFTQTHACEIIVKHLDNFFVAAKGQISTTKIAHDLPIWRVDTATRAAVWRLQNPTRPFEALTTALIDL